jgi:hypothetical protein
VKFSIDLRHRMSPVGDQGIRPTCVAFALTACHEYVYSQSPKELSKDSLHWGCVKRGASAVNGVFPGTALITLRQEGQHFEEDWPYIPNMDEATWESLEHPKLDGKSTFKITQGQPVDISDSDTLSQKLKIQGPLFVTLPIWQSFFIPKNGRISMPQEESEEYRGSHAVCVVGLTEKGDAFIRNSWGLNWGIAGHAVLPFEYLKKYTSCSCTLVASEE